MHALTESGSVYEIDLKNHAMRRISGAAAATPRQGPDGVWRKFNSLLPVKLDRCMFVEWIAADLPGELAAAKEHLPATVTSRVTMLEGEVGELDKAYQGIFNVASGA